VIREKPVYYTVQQLDLHSFRGHKLLSGYGFLRAITSGGSSMTFTQSIQTVFSKYATFSGRATRSEFWWWILFIAIVMFVAGLLDSVLVGPALGFGWFAQNGGQPLSVLVSLGLLVPNIAVAVRRLHDIGRTGWWVLIGFIPLIGFVVLLYWYVQPSEDGQNQYG
jgi:uncharacterized membrane protein YhaH (DUF805 family)